jgi:flagellar basal body-associated protein FliL
MYTSHSAHCATRGIIIWTLSRRKKDITEQKAHSQKLLLLIVIVIIIIIIIIIINIHFPYFTASSLAGSQNSTVSQTKHFLFTVLPKTF